MKTRREFLNCTLKSIGLVGIASLAPSYALAKVAPPEVIHMGTNSTISNTQLKNCKIIMGTHCNLAYNSFITDIPGPIITFQ